MADQTPADALDHLKAELLTQFEDACRESRTYSVSADARAANRHASSTIALALVALEKEQREAGLERTKFSMPGK